MSCEFINYCCCWFVVRWLTDKDFSGNNISWIGVKWIFFLGFQFNCNVEPTETKGLPPEAKHAHWLKEKEEKDAWRV